MAGRVVFGNLLTGRDLVDIPFLKYKWERRRNAPPTFSVDVSLGDPDTASLGLRNIATAGKSMGAILEDDVFMVGGELGRPSYDRDESSYSIPGSGIWASLADRTILPPSALSVDVTTFTIPDPVTPTKTIPNPALGTYLTALDYGSIIGAWITQAMSWPGGSLPIIVPAPVAGTRVKSVEGVELRNLAEAITDVTQFMNGPDVTFAEQWQSDRRGVQWLLRTGTDAQPRIRSDTVQTFNLSAEETTTRGLKTAPLQTPFGSLAWVTGGRSSDQALVARSYDPFLVNSGFPLKEIVDTSNVDVSDTTLLGSRAQDIASKGKLTPEVWTFQIRKDAAPYPGDYGIGDRCLCIVEGDPIIPDSPDAGYLREIAGLSGDEGDWITVTTTEV